MASALHWRRLSAAAAVTLVLSLGPLVSPALLDFFSPSELALAWLVYLGELTVIAAVLLLAFAVTGELLPRSMPLRLASICVVLLVISVALSVLLHVYYAGGLEQLPPMLRMLADSLRWGLPAVFLALTADLHRRALQADSDAHAAELARAQLRHAESEQQLALLQAQIEPHFLFNVLGNLRRLYRMHPQAGAESIESLLRYLRTALPRLRRSRTTVREELALVQAYLELFRLRMGQQLTYAIEADPLVLDAEFPPMLVMTLVENAVKHGVQPAGGGRIEVRVRRLEDVLEVTVRDDGVGFAATASSGTGVGLANIRRQLAARYRDRGQLVLEARAPRGAGATLRIPLA